jgi:DNA primase
MLKQAGYRPEEIAAAGVVADARWPGRLCGAWRDGSAGIRTIWARASDDVGLADAKYLYLRGATRTNLPPYGLSEWLTEPASGRREIVLVEGFLDAHQLRARGIQNAAALGGTSIGVKGFEQLQRLGVGSVALCFDNDHAGRAAAARAVENAARAHRGPDVSVVDPGRLAPAKDPDEFIRRSGAAAFEDLLNTRTCAIVWRANELAAVPREPTAHERRAALARVGRWLGTLPPRLALEQEDALRTVAERCGYTPEAVERAFRARYWRPPAHELQPGRPELVRSW